MVFGRLLPKCLRSERKIALPYNSSFGVLPEVTRRKAAAQIEHRERDAALGAGPEHRRRRSQRPVPGLDMVLLGADVERQAVRHQTLPERELQDVGGIDRLAAELARQRPFGAGAIADDATEHAAATRGAGRLLDFGFAVDGEQADAERKRRGGSRGFLDGVAVGNAVGAGAGFEHGSGFADRCDIERAAEAGEEFQDLTGAGFLAFTA